MAQIKELKTTPTIEYDKSADILYVTFGTREPSYCEEVDDFLLMERGIFSRQPTGFRLINFKEILQKQNIKELTVHIVEQIKKDKRDVQQIMASALSAREKYVKERLKKDLVKKELVEIPA